VERGIAYLQPGKDLALSVFPERGVHCDGLLLEVQKLMRGVDESLVVQTSASGIDISPAGIDKAEGVRWLAEEVGISTDAMGGVGDSQGDLAFLRVVGRSACPANAGAEVQSSVDYVSCFENGAAVVDILQRWNSA
jgi:hydroxymethylpyrimidine pyrophosphatase-like HAD family hydrolase